MTPIVSVVVPLFNEELVIDEMHRRLTDVLKGMGLPYEIVLVDDGSRDSTRERARAICSKDSAVRLIVFSRNFGHQIAITAGMDKAVGQCVIVIDADLQDPPELIPVMVDKWRTDSLHVVYAVREKRAGESWFKLATAKLFYRVLRRLTAVDIPVDTGDFRLIDRKALQHLLSMRERARFVRGMVSWVGFKQGSVTYHRDARFAGETKYPFRKMVRFAADGILAFSQVPLKLASAFGFMSAGISFLFMVYGLVIRNFYPEFAVPGWASTFSAVLFLGGVQLICLGILGEYVGRIYEEVKGRPLYIVEQEFNAPAQESTVRAGPDRFPVGVDARASS